MPTPSPLPAQLRELGTQFAALRSRLASDTAAQVTFDELAHDFATAQILSARAIGLLQTLSRATPAVSEGVLSGVRGIVRATADVNRHLATALSLAPVSATSQPRPHQLRLAEDRLQPLPGRCNWLAPFLATAGTSARTAAGRAPQRGPLTPAQYQALQAIARGEAVMTQRSGGRMFVYTSAETRITRRSRSADWSSVTGAPPSSPVRHSPSPRPATPP
ncbi:hypothetical protein ACIBUY_04370 [Streptomyces sp. NPDC050085]|uniref:hypothetical protein n=1 Tax=Streptomyces sp. NPDC050085 TaxID=3365600 RepID=UPI0037B755EB